MLALTLVLVVVIVAKGVVATSSLTCNALCSFPMICRPEYFLFV